jgi:hypothetical protein
MNKPQYYTPTGTFDPFRVLTALLLLLPLWLISFVYAGLLHWNPLTILSPILLIGYVFIVSGLAINAINFSNTQNKHIALFVTLLFAFFALYFSWANFLAIWRNDFPVDLLRPEYLWELLTHYFDEGAYNTFGIRIDGVFGLIIWVLEGVAILGTIILLVKSNVLEEVYCTSCDRWIEEIEEFYAFTYPDEKKLIQKFKSSEFDFLDETEEMTGEDLSYYQLNASCCNTCSKSYYLSLDKITVEQSDEKGGVELNNTPLVQLLKVSQQNFRQLYAKSRHWFHFTESGKYSPFVWLGLPSMAVVVFILGAIYQTICLNVANYYVSGIAFFGYALLLYFSTNFILERFSVRNKVVSTFFGVLFGTLTVYITHTVLFPADILNPIRWLPNSIWLLLRVYVEGQEIAWLAWTGLIVETGMMFFVPIAAAWYLSSSRVYCEHCDEWAEEEDDIYLFNHPDLEGLKRKFTHQDLGFLEESSPIDNDSYDFFKLNAEWCKQCDTIHTLSLLTVKKKINSDGEAAYSDDTLYEDVIYTHDAFHGVLDFVNKVNEPVDASASKVDV